MSVTMIEQSNNCDMHLHAEIDVLKERLLEKQNQLIAMETACLRETDRQVELEDSIIAWQDKYDRLYESHKRVQKINQNLEDKLLKLVDRNSNERAQLTSDVATLSVRLAQANYNIAKLQREIERYKTDINLAIQLLQCKPESFVPQKVSSLPIDIQSKVSSYMRLETASHSDSEDNTSGVGVATSGSYKVLPASDSPPPVCPFPPTAMVYSMRGLDGTNSDGLNINNNNNNNNNNNQNINNNINNVVSNVNSAEQMISPSIVAKYLENELKTNEIKHCDTCKCSTNDLTVLAIEQKSITISTQTINFGGNGGLVGDNNNSTSLCLRCNNNLNSPSRTNSPFMMKLLKSNDSIVSETKSSSLSDLIDGDHKIFLPPKKDDLMVNPILGHHRLCDRTTNKNHLHHHLQNELNTHQHQHHFNETTKYFLENHNRNTKTSNTGDLIDLRKINEKSGNLVILNGDDYYLGNCGDRRNSRKMKIGNDKLQQNNLRVDCAIGGDTNDNLQGKNKSDNITNNDFKKLDGKLDNVNSGSVTSLWSKTSDSEGAKLFENFNRNLIKTIKSDNPKHRGPRLCAMRIQSNGSSNILLDNIESDITPIIYTRRQKFVDEELDDKKDIITLKTSYGNGSLQQQPQTIVPSVDSKNLLNQNSQCNSTIIDIENVCTNIKLNVNDDNNSEPKLIKDQLQTTDDDQHEINMTEMQLITLNDPFNAKPQMNFLDQQLDQLNESTIINTHKNNEIIQLNVIGNNEIELVDDSNQIVVNNSSCKNSKTTCTQSSSISEIDLQESVLLRRQQLNRVAEWVKNNSKIEIEQQKEMQQQIKLLEEQLASDNNYNNNNNNNNNKIYCINNRNNQFDNITTNQSSFEKLSIDSGYKTTNKNQYERIFDTTANNFTKYSYNNDGICNNNNNNNNNFENSNLNYHKKNLNNTFDIAEQNNFVFNQKYYNNKTIDNLELNEIMENHKYQQQEQQQQLQQQQQKQNNINQINVDLAQMEYNVKQFLLKQNEWSIQNLNNNCNNNNQYKSPLSSNMSSRTAGDGHGSSSEGIINAINPDTPDLISSNKFNPNNDSNQTFFRNYPHRTETNL